MSVCENIKKAIEQVSVELDLGNVDVEIEIASDSKFGDYSSNVAMKLARPTGLNPVDLANSFVEKLNEHILVKSLATFSQAGPGFLNIKLLPQVISKNLQMILDEKDSFGKNNIFAGKKILVEHSSPNLFKPFHIGHFMNNAIGESLVRLMQSSGATVVSMSYPSDVSLGIGKAVWSLVRNKDNKLLDSSSSENEKLVAMGEAYADGSKAYNEDETAKEEIREIARGIYARRRDLAWQIYEKGKDLSLQSFNKITKRLGSSFENFVFESEAGERGKEIVKSHVGEIFKESNGAVIYEGEEDGLHTRVFINSEGNPTYEAKDIGLMSIKNNLYSPDVSVTVTDHEQSEYFRVVAKAAGKIESKWEQNFKHVPHGRMQFKGARMSSRLGGIPLVEDIISVVREEVLERAGGRELPDFAIDSVAIASLKFAILKSEAGKNINFDPETSLSFEGDSGPYLQYTYARTQSLLRKGKEKDILPEVNKDGAGAGLVERKLLHYKEFVKKSQLNYSAHHLVGYLLELSREFNSWYGRERILDGEGREHSLAVVASVGQVLKNGLSLLAIQAPSEM